MKRKIRHGQGRSTLFVWMVDHHADLMTKDRSGRMPWIDLCADFVHLGLTDGEGKLPTPKRAGATWRAVCAEVEAQAKRARREEHPASPVHRSRQQDWQPPLAASGAHAVPTIRGYDLDEELPPRRPMAEPSAGSDGAPEKKMTIADLSPEGRAKIERLRQQFAETDRKRFGSF